MHKLCRLGWGEGSGSAGRAGHLLAKQSCTVQGVAGWCKEREKRERENAGDDGDERSLAGGGLRPTPIRRQRLPSPHCSAGR